MSTHPGSQQTGTGVCLLSALVLDGGSLAGEGLPPPNLEACVRRAESPPRLTPFSLCSWPSSPRILLAATQKPSPLRYPHPDGFCPRSLLEPWNSPTLRPASLQGALGAPSSHLPCVSLPCPDKCPPPRLPGAAWTISSGSPRGSLLGNVAESHVASWTPTRKCCAAFGTTFCG